jgi:hypothetical protein
MVLVDAIWERGESDPGLVLGRIEWFVEPVDRHPITGPPFDGETWQDVIHWLRTMPAHEILNDDGVVAFRTEIDALETWLKIRAPVETSL